MKFIIFLSTMFALIAIFSSPASSGADRCFVSPDPVTLGSDFTVTATGLTPNANYYINITQAKDSSNGAHPQDGRVTDASGSFTYTRNTYLPPDGILGAGNAKVRIYPADAVGRGTEQCWFTVV